MHMADKKRQVLVVVITKETHVLKLIMCLKHTSM